mgnify:FL=1|jgi:hypothetical protein
MISRVGEVYFFMEMDFIKREREGKGLDVLCSCYRTEGQMVIGYK